MKNLIEKYHFSPTIYDFRWKPTNEYVEFVKKHNGILGLIPCVQKEKTINYINDGYKYAVVTYQIDTDNGGTQFLIGADAIFIEEVNSIDDLRMITLFKDKSDAEEASKIFNKCLKSRNKKNFTKLRDYIKSLNHYYPYMEQFMKDIYGDC